MGRYDEKIEGCDENDFDGNFCMPNFQKMQLHLYSKLNISQPKNPPDIYDKFKVVM